ncbi:AIR synthase-related protein, partial [Staphylococcus aureus]|nr:AIR synthase-related protein [Staphylococcus aureus]
LAADKGWKMNRPALFDQEILLIDALIAPTRIYVSSLLPVVKSGRIAAMAHITGGGLLENIPRVLGENLTAVLDAKSWTMPPLFQWLQQHGGVADAEMHRVFNCGIGMAVVVAADQAEAVAATLAEAGETVLIIGRIEAGERGCTVKGSAGTWSAKADWTATHAA